MCRRSLVGGARYGMLEAGGKAVDCRLLGDVGKMPRLGVGDLLLVVRSSIENLRTTAGSRSLLVAYGLERTNQQDRDGSSSKSSGGDVEGSQLGTWCLR